MSVLLIAGGPSERSRTAALLDAAGQRLEARGVLVDQLRVRELSPQALLLADFGHRSICQAILAVDSQTTLSPDGSYSVARDISERLDAAVDILVNETSNQSLGHAGRFASVHFSQVLCSV